MIHLTKRIILMVMLVFSCGLAAQATRVTMNVNNVKVIQAMKQLKKMTGYTFIFYSKDIDVNKTVNVKANNADMSDVVSQILAGQNVDFSIEGNHIVLSKKTATSPKTGASPEPQQDKKKNTVRGTVTDANGDPVIGASVRVKGSSTGAVTDINGNYTLDANPGDVLEFSYVGFGSKDIKVNRSDINVTLAEDETTLSDLVVVGYGVVKKADLTGAIGSLSSKDIENIPQASVTSMMQGKIAGVNITTTDGVGNMKIRVRGTTSLTKSSEPLWVVDGVIGAPQPTNPDDIESIEVLKDASSTAIYGAQGANGVILVTTKRAQEGQRITFDTRLSWKTARKKADLLDPYEYATAYNEFNGDYFTAEQLQGWKDGTLESVDWQDLLIRTGFDQRYGLSLSGGSKRTKYLVTGAFSDSKRQVITTRSRSYNIKGQLTTDITPWLTFDGYLYMSGSKGHNTQNGIGLGDAYAQSPTSDIYLEIYRSSPTRPLIDEATGAYTTDDTNSTNMSNGIANRKAAWIDTRSHTTMGFGSLNFKIIDGLTFTSSLLYNRGDSWWRSIVTSKVNPQTYRSGSSANGTANTHSYSFRNINNLAYMKQFGDHRINANLVAEYYKYKYTSVSTTTTGLANEDLGYWNLAGSNYSLGSGYSNSAMASYMGRVVYSYKDRYVVTGTLRADGASQLSKDNRWAWFPSIGVAWNAHEENFVNKDIFSQLKLRLSYGSIGNANIDAYSTIPALASFGYTYAYGLDNYSVSAFWPGTAVNSDLKWERTQQGDIGIDVGLFNNRITLTADVYLKKTTDLLLQKATPLYYGIPNTSGYASGTMWVNQGELRNKGLELTLGGLPVVTKNFTWESTFTAAYNRSKIVDLGGDDRMFINNNLGAMFQNVYVMQKGSQVGRFYLYDWQGFDENGVNLYRQADGTLGTTISGAERIVTGKAIPDWTFGWNNTFQYKNWDATVAMRWTSHYDRLNGGRFFAGQGAGTSRFITLRDAYYKNWDKVSNKSQAKFASYTNTDSEVVGYSTEWLENGTFFRLQTLAIGYTFPRKWTHFADIHLGFSVDNLFVISGYRGLDPETVSANASSDVSYGFDGGSLPMPRTYQFSARFTF